MRARGPSEYVLIRADQCPAGVVAELRANGVSVQELSRQWPDGEPQDWLRLPREVAALFLPRDAGGPADS